MKSKQPLTQKRLKELLRYDPETGIFKRKVFRNYNADIGDIAGSVGHYGYICIRVDYKTYRAHRLAWLYVYGYFPENDVDHINREPSDNRIVNLREVSKQCNMRNCKIRATNKSGVTGVAFHKRDKKWAVDIMDNYKRFFLGNYGDFKNAVRARWDAEVKHGFPNCNTTSSAYLYLKSIGDVK